MKPHFQMMAGYNRWANERIYAAARQLSDADYRADRGAFFGSVHRTLNHILVADRIWMFRFTGIGPTYSELDSILHDDFQTLSAARNGGSHAAFSWMIWTELITLSLCGAPIIT